MSSYVNRKRHYRGGVVIDGLNDYAISVTTTDLESI